MPRAAPVASRLVSALVPLALSAALIGCGGDDGESSADSVSTEAPPAADFPAADGRPLEQIVAEAGATDQVVISPAGAVFTVGKNRLGFGVFDVARTQITDADVAIYAAPAKGGPAVGPFPAAVESLETDPAFTAQTTAADPDSAKAVYVADVDFNRPGPWNLVGLVKEGDTYTAARIPGVRVGEETRVPQPGDKAPVVHTPTEEEVGDLAEIDTREPHDTMHEEDLADVLGEEPVVLNFATPRLCVSRVCGPVVDVAEQVKAERDDEAAFIHMEIYEDNTVDKGLRPQVEAYGLPTEPWLFVIDEDGRVSTVIEGAFGVDELNAALDKVAGA